MLIYGDPHFRAGLCAFARAMRLRFLGHSRDELETWRELLVQAGQLEQGLEDSDERNLCEEIKTRARQITDGAAEGFLACLGSKILNPLRENLDTSIRMIESGPNTQLTIKVPEGFEFYGLFPEQYVLAARQWAWQHRPANDKRVIVAGVRSIGTGLSAVVRKALEQEGWQASRLTTRPTGEPFRRRVDPGPGFRGYDFGLVVDEGPGISGSSMVAVAEALQESGVHHIAFFPGHYGEPGRAANDRIRSIWTCTPRYVGGEIAWLGRSLQQVLLERSAAVLGETVGSLRFQDCSAGAWRWQALPVGEKWPAVSPAFERSKFLVSGCAPHARLLWKFCGLGCLRTGGKTARDLERERTMKLVSEGLVSEIVDYCHGFEASHWVEGRRLVRSDAKQATVLEHLARYLLVSQGHSMEKGEVRESLNRLKQMLHCNAQLELGLAGKEKAEVLSCRVTEHPGDTYGDGRMAPWEWVITPEGRILKTDSTGHAYDHTLIGRQSWLWDLAGLIVEWDLDDSQLELVQRHLGLTSGQVDESSLLFYRAAYAASRLGILWAGGSQGAQDLKERERRRQAQGFYRHALATTLELGDKIEPAKLSTPVVDRQRGN